MGDTQALDELRGEIHHLLSPVIGFMRMAECDAIDFKRHLRYSIDRLEQAMDACDAALGEKPTREQIDDLQRELLGDLNG